MRRCRVRSSILTVHTRARSEVLTLHLTASTSPSPPAMTATAHEEIRGWGAWGQTEFQVNLKLGLTPRSGPDPAAERRSDPAERTPRLSRRSSASARARLTRHFAISRSMRKKSARNTSAFSPELPREIPRSSSHSSTLATPGSWNTCESEHEPAGEGIAMKAILADNDVEGILAALVSNRRMPPPAAPCAHGSERLQIFQQIGKLSLGQLAQARDGVGAVGAGEGCANVLERPS